jgi:tetratricopeptide (TPR) repeat protein
MASLIPGYEYDIFISYRQKDNKHDGWVTEFVDNLKGELESTFKEDISIYFDENPHDGLLETHDVDASLKDKLKCLIFIPIISRTYCDPKSFAWEHEFKTFIELASKDQFGLKIRLLGGNIASRVLPVQIHDLNAEDRKVVEGELGGYLRAIEFIYKESGVNRPITPKDSEEKNTNKTNYRNQINKVANAIDEIISGLKAEPTITAKEKTPSAKEPVNEGKKEERKEQQVKPAKLNKRKLISGVAILAIIIIVVFAYPKIFKRDTLEKLRSSGEKISVAVMPFQNLTNDTLWNVWQDGIQVNLITSLTNSEELKVRQTESINNLIQVKGLTNYASITPSVASKISQKLEASLFIRGNITKEGTIIRINAQLINSKTEEVFKSFQIDGTTEKIMPTIDTLSCRIKDYLIISKLKKDLSLDFQQFASTNSPEAYRYFICGNNAYSKNDMSTAAKFFLHAIAIDSNFYFAALRLASAYWNLGLIDEGKKWCIKVYKKRDQMPMQIKLWTNSIYSLFFETPHETIKCLRQLQEIDDQSPLIYYSIGRAYIEDLYQYEKAIPEFEKALEIYNKWDSKPMWVFNYTWLGTAYHKAGLYKKEKELYKKAEQDFPDNLYLINRQAILSLNEGDTIAANKFIEKYKSILAENPTSEADINASIGLMYFEASYFDKSEQYLRQALSYEPNNPDRLNSLAWLLVDKDRNVHEGLELVDKALKLIPDSWQILDTKGWGLYKQGKYQEALKVIQRADSLKPIYSHGIFLHLEAAKKAVAGQK